MEEKKNITVAPTYIAINVLQIDLKLRSHFSASVGFKAAVKHGISIAKFMNELISMLDNTASTIKTATTMTFRLIDLSHSMVSRESACEAQLTSLR